MKHITVIQGRVFKRRRQVAQDTLEREDYIVVVKGLQKPSKY